MALRTGYGHPASPAGCAGLDAAHAVRYRRALVSIAGLYVMIGRSAAKLLATAQLSRAAPGSNTEGHNTCAALFLLSSPSLPPRRSLPAPLRPFPTTGRG